MKRLKKRLYSGLFFILFFLTACATPRSEAYRMFYAHLKTPPLSNSASVIKSAYFLEIFVNARHLDYTNNQSFLKTMAKHPSDGSKNRDVGHAWIYLEGVQNGQKICLEGGHSGELGRMQSKYFDGIMNYIDFGYANPSPLEYESKRWEPNPIKYLWETQYDGYFQFGSGKHVPTYGIRVNLNQEQFENILHFIAHYTYKEYAITRNQCSSFVVQVAALADLALESEVTMAIQPFIFYGGMNVRLWTDPAYSQLTISSPDILEKSLMEAVKNGKAVPIK